MSTYKQEQLRIELSKLTPARLARGRAGLRPRTTDWLNFRADHARAKDACLSEFSQNFIDKYTKEHNYKIIQTSCSSKEEFILFPPKGKSADSAELEKLNSCQRHNDVQIVIVDGLSANAVEKNISSLISILEDGLNFEQISTGTPIIVKFGRVAIGDQIAHYLKAKLVVTLIGERPGLSSSDSLSAYITYNPGPNTISSDRTVVSNIHWQGTPAIEAGAYIVQLCKKILKLKLSGVRLQMHKTS